MKAVISFVMAVGLLAAAPFAQVLYHPGDPGLVVPIPVRMEKPEYPDDARSQGIAGDVILQAVIHADGAVGDIKVTKSLDTKYGLDDKAAEALTRSVFKPGTKDGKPVDVQVNVTVQFRLKTPPR